MNIEFTEQEIMEELVLRPWLVEGDDYDFDCVANYVNEYPNPRLSLADRIDEFEHLANI